MFLLHKCCLASYFSLVLRSVLCFNFFAWLQISCKKATISFSVLVHPPVCVKQHGAHQMDVHNDLYWGLLLKFVWKSQFWLKLHRNDYVEMYIHLWLLFSCYPGYPHNQCSLVTMIMQMDHKCFAAQRVPVMLTENLHWKVCLWSLFCLIITATSADSQDEPWWCSDDWCTATGYG
jgi:hypothetical protein